MSDLKESRGRVRNALGSKFEEKASDALCLALDRPVPALTALEAIPAAQRNVRAVVEFNESTRLARTVDASQGEAGRARVWGEALKGMRAALREHGASATAARAETLFNAAMLLRDLGVKQSREHFYQSVATLRDEVERKTTGMFALRPESMAAPGLATSLTQVCWLNQTMRTWTDRHALASVAGDPRVDRIDLPRPLKAELDITAVTVGAVAFRTRSAQTGKGIIVAVIDSEVAAAHPAFGQRVVHRRNYTDEPWGHPDAHGTGVAGIIASAGPGRVGMAPEATIYNYKVLANNAFLNSDDFGGALALQHALEDGAHVANCSWGAGRAGNGTSREARACDTAWEHGMTVVKSAGNDGPEEGTLTTPADAKGVIVVAATDRNGQGVQDYSSRGREDGPRPHLCAPGGTLQDGVNSCELAGGFGSVGAGTSFAAPHVSGLLALLLEASADLTPDEQREQLLGFCTPFTGVSGLAQGRGLVTLA